MCFLGVLGRYMRKLFVLLSIFGIGYGLAALWDPATNYFMIRHGAHRLAAQAKVGPISAEAMRKVLDSVYRDTGLELYSSDVNMERDTEMVTVRIHAVLPILLPLMNRKIEQPVTIAITERWGAQRQGRQ